MLSFEHSIWFLATVFAVFGATGSKQAVAAEKLKLLIIDGQNNHNWQAMTPLMKAELEKTGRFSVDVATTPPENSPPQDWSRFRPDFSKYAVVLSNFNSMTEYWPDEVQVALAKYVGNGGGLVIIHAANNAFPNWAEWNKMIGLGWRENTFGDRITLDAQGKPVRTEKGLGPGAGHGEQHEFVIDVHEPEHPVMHGMPLHWLHANDELYHGQRGPAADMHILASAFCSKDKKGTGEREPMIWWVPYGKGRVFTTVMGHVGADRKDTRAIRCVGFITVMTRGCEWAATGKVTLPLPDNFPKPDATSLAPEAK
jgi:type 1 glutamine amidotransferase